MRRLLVFLILLVVASAVFFFTKPADSLCRAEAIKIVSQDLIKVPGYSDPNSANESSSGPQTDKILIKDYILWKDVSYIYPGSVRKVGRGYLGNFHPEK